jgi:hypothetical protein
MNLDVGVSDGGALTESTTPSLSVTVLDTMEAVASLGLDLTLLLADSLGTSDLLAAGGKYAIPFDDAGAATDGLVFGRVFNLVDEGEGADSLTAQMTAVVDLIDTLVASETITGAGVFNLSLAVLASGSDTFAMAKVYDLADNASGADAMTGLLNSFAVLSDTGEAVESLAIQKVMAVVLTENLQVSDAATVVSIMNVAFEDNIAIHAFLSLGAATYDAWTINTENQGVTEYQGFLGNSTAYFDRNYLAAGEGGIYSLDGDTDDGEDITATLRTGIDKLGTEYMKRIPNVYLGTTKDGALLLKVATTDAGVKRRNWYTLRAVQKQAVTDERFDVAKGLKSVYWQLEIENALGSDFELENVKLWRLVLSRRK